MKYLIPLNEEFNGEVASLKLEKGAPKINRQELLALIDVAQEEENWSEVKRLLGLLNSTNESSLLDYSRYSLLLESVQEAKPIIQKLVDEDLRKAKIELREVMNSVKRERMEEPGEKIEEPEEEASARLKEKEERLKEQINKKYFGPGSDYEKIKRMLNFQGPIAAFVRFRYQQGAPLERLEELNRLLTDLRDYLAQLPMSVDEYSKLLSSPETIAPGYELLGEELTKLLELRGGNWLISKLPKDARRKLIEAGLATGSPINLREEFRKAPREIQIELQKEASKLNALNAPHLLRLVLGQVPAKGSIADVLDLVKKTIRNADDVDRSKILETAMNSYPSVAVLYAEGDHFVFSFRNDSQLPHLCAKATGWCIQPSWYNKGYADQFWSYASGSLQLGIIDFTVDPSNPYHTVGVTISPNRSVRSLCNQPNHCTSGSDYRDLLKGFECFDQSTGRSDGRHSYPAEMIIVIDENFNREVSLKTQTDGVYKKIKEYSKGERDYEQALAKTLIGMVRDLKSLTETSGVTADDLKAGSEANLANQVIASEIKNLRKSPVILQVQKDYVQRYSEGVAVLPSPADVKIFEIVMEDSPLLTQKLISNLVTKNKAVLTSLAGHMQKMGASVDTPLAKKLRLINAGLEDAVTALEVLKEKIK